MPERLRITCADLHRDADLVADLVPDVFGAHDPGDLDYDDRCLCYESIVNPGGWDEGNRLEANRRCSDTTVLIGDGFRLEVCCRCADQDGVTREALAAAAARLAPVLRSGAGAMHRDPAIGRAIAAYRDSGASSTEAALLAGLDLIGVGGAR